jgi:hypothetical protein
MQMQVLFLCFLAAIPSRAQVANNTSLVGTVTDANGVVMGAKVTAVNAGTNDTYSATTDEQGNYSITFVREGTYTITTEQVGFRKSVLDQADEIHIHDEWTKKKFAEGKYKSSEIYPSPSDAKLQQE